MNQEHVEAGIIALIKKAETELPDDVTLALKYAYSLEDGLAKLQLETILKNIAHAKKTGRPMCQDTGIQTFFVTVGTESPYRTTIEEIITSAVRKATIDIPLRPNTVDPFTDRNSEDNTGEHVPSITWKLSPGKDLRVTAFPKGGGSENMSRLVMLNPSVGIPGVKQFVVQEIIRAGGGPCPPTTVGVGIGGGADVAMMLAKTALLRPIGERHKEKKVATIEQELIEEINGSGIGPMGLGGKTTVLDVHIEKAHRHPASLPVGLVIQCWANRRSTMVIHRDGTWEMH
ncbi:MAG TPA: fumarate hydratase [Candidatus Thermoplasmatota archaeon]|nr:fumarate hydratase [Candidatus Thermoplasmatota archaeon]